MYIEDLEVLLIESNPEISKKIIRYINNIDEDYHVTLIQNPVAALQIIKDDSNFYNCIFYNYNLPNTNGLEFLNELKTWEVNSIIAVYDIAPNHEKAINLIKNGVFDYLELSELSEKRIDKIISSVFRHLILANEKEEYIKKIKEKDKMIKAITNSSPNIIYVYNIITRKIDFYNQNLFKSLGYDKVPFKEGKAINQMIERISTDAIYQGLNNYLSKVFKCKSDKKFEFEFKLKDVNGNWIWFLRKDIIFKRNSNNNAKQVLVTLSNITELKETEKALKQAKIEAEQSAKTKAEFLSNMSHEIRTPMNAIIGLTDIMLSEKLSSFLQGNLKLVKESADNLLVIINDILDLSKLEAGKVKVEKIPFSIKDKMDHLSKIIAPRFTNDAVKFNLIIDENIDPYLIGDPFRINQILLNLLSNAIKFTEKGSVDLVVKLLYKDSKSNKIIFSVKDTGLGIPKDKQKSIFESFTQADLSTTRNFGGTGLGLTITKLLINLLGGEISLESEFMKGSSFNVILDFEISKQSVCETKSLIEEHKFPHSNLLVVEDNLINQKVISQILKKWEIKFELAGNGKVALEKLRNHEFDIILMDLQMPIMDGFEATNMIRNDKEFNDIKNIPIIALTADAFLETKNKVFKSKMNDFVSKPFDKKELNIKIHELIKA